MKRWRGEVMDYFPVLVDEAGAMITDVIENFVN